MRLWGLDSGALTRIAQTAPRVPSSGDVAQDILDEETLRDAATPLVSDYFVDYNIELQYLPPWHEQLRPTEGGQDPDKIEDIQRQMDEAGGWPESIPPIVVGYLPDTGVYEILDGHHRWLAALDAEFDVDEIPVYVLYEPEVA